MEEVEQWLLSGPPWVEYGTLKDLLGMGPDDRNVLSARERMASHPMIMSLVEELLQWPKVPIRRHNDAGHPIHKLVFLADLGFTRDDDHIDDIVEKVLSIVSDEGPLELPWQLYKRWMGKEGVENMWAMCDAPLLHYSMIKMGYGDDDRVRIGTKVLIDRVMDNGWRCGGSEKLGKFRGPGSRGSICPYATLIMMKLLSTSEKLKRSREASKGAEALLQRWEMKGKEKPFLFGVGTDFKKLKLPFIWYDIVHMTDVLSRFERVRKDERLIDMIDILRSKAGNGMYTPESIWMAWKGWDFCQKKEPSRYLTLCVERILRRY